VVKMVAESLGKMAAKQLIHYGIPAAAGIATGITAGYIIKGIQVGSAQAKSMVIDAQSRYSEAQTAYVEATHPALQTQTYTDKLTGDQMVLSFDPATGMLTSGTTGQTWTLSQLQAAGYRAQSPAAPAQAGSETQTESIKWILLGGMGLAAVVMLAVMFKR
jgi:hypothetical protein